MGKLRLMGDTSGYVDLVVPAAAGTTEITMPATSDTLVGKSTTDVLTNKTINATQIINASITSEKLSGAQSGSAPIYGVRAWVNFNGTGTPAIRSSGNVSSITDNGQGDYTINFTTALPDANFAVITTGSLSAAVVPNNSSRTLTPIAFTTSSVRIVVTDGVSGADLEFINVVIIR